jgi:hypothetical protein
MGAPGAANLLRIAHAPRGRKEAADGSGGVSPNS